MEYLVIFTKSGQQNIPFHASLHPLLQQFIANSEGIKSHNKIAVNYMSSQEH